MGSSKRRRHHVFLFRHCVRSTESDVSLFHDGGSKQNVSDFTASALPDWNVPPLWCTQAGMKIMQNTGTFLMNVLADDKDVRSIKVQIVTDMVQRDVDTSFAISQGMAKAVPTGVSVDGLSNLIYNRALFSPLNASKYYPPNQKEGPLCEMGYSDARMKQDVEARLQRIRPPDPGLNSTLAHFDRLGGVGVAGPLTSILPFDYTLVKNEEDSIKLEGAVNVAKVLSQMMFYSRASGIYPPFLPNATIEEVYQLLAWVHWTRSVLKVRNAQTATEGAVLAHAALEALEHGQFKSSSTAAGQEGDYDATATLFVGHDGNLDALGTALGVKWRLGEPYVQADDYVPTPPGSAIHASFDSASGHVELSFLYPVLLKGRGTSWTLHKGGGLESVPLVFDPPLDQEDVTISTDEKKTVLSTSDITRSGLDILQTRVLSVLEEYPGATECYRHLPFDSPQPLSSQRVDFRMMALVVAAVALAIVSLSLLVLHQRKQRSKRFGCETQEAYDVVHQRGIEVL